MKNRNGLRKFADKPGTNVTEIELTKDTIFVRVYDGNSSKQYGGWLMKQEDVAGLTPLQIQNNFALPTNPKYITYSHVQNISSLV